MFSCTGNPTSLGSFPGASENAIWGFFLSVGKKRALVCITVYLFRVSCSYGQSSGFQSSGYFRLLSLVTSHSSFLVRRSTRLHWFSLLQIFCCFFVHEHVHEQVSSRQFYVHHPTFFTSVIKSLHVHYPSCFTSAIKSRHVHDLLSFTSTIRVDSHSGSLASFFTVKI